MRLRLGRPEISDYADRFDVPLATSGSPVSVTFLGVSTLLIDDGSTSLLTDGFFSRPSLPKVALGRLAPHRGRIRNALERAGADRVEAVLPVHTHFDHAMDSAVVAQLTGAQLVGGRSSANIGHGHGLAEEQITVATSGAPMDFGLWRVTEIESHHCPPDRFPGEIDQPLQTPAKAGAYKCGEAWSILVEHTPSNRSLLVQGSAGFVPGALHGHSAEVAYLGVGQLGVQDEAYIETYWAETVRTVGARAVVLIHWDDFFRSLDHPLRALPYAGDDLDVTMRVLGRLAAEDGVRLHLPTVWNREDPWAR
jgi:L-ascorbate metabolism protein UlaG (beta-lactamase superfamily)